MSEEEFTKWLVEHLSQVGLDDEVFIDYIMTILKEVDMDQDEITVSLQSFLESAGDVPDNIVEEIVAKWNEIKEDDVLIAADENKPATKISLSKVLAESVALVSKEQDNANMKKMAMSSEERERRELLLKQYEDEEYEEVAEDSEDEANANKQRMIENGKKQREEQQTEANRVKAQNAMALKKDKINKQEKKEARQKAAQKGERKR